MHIYIAINLKKNWPIKAIEEHQPNGEMNMISGILGHIEMAAAPSYGKKAQKHQSKGTNDFIAWYVAFSL